MHFSTSSDRRSREVVSNRLANLATVNGGTWKPKDPDDPVVTLSDYDYAVTETIEKKAISLVMTATPLSSAGAVPGTQIEYRLSFRISDYLQFAGLIIDDVLSDGLSYVPGSARFSARDASGALIDQTFEDRFIESSAPVTGTYRCPAGGDTPCERAGSTDATKVLPGATALRFRFSSALSAAPNTPFPGGSLRGGALTSGASATGELVFLAAIGDHFSFGPHSANDDGAVDAADPLLHSAEIHGDLVQIGGSCSDHAVSCGSVPNTQLEKRVVAQNEELLDPIPIAIGDQLPEFTLGDRITYRLRVAIPTGDVEALTIRDWFPKPVLSADELGALVPCQVLPPGLNQPCVVLPAGVPLPTLSVDGDMSSLTLEFGNLESADNVPITIDIYITLKVSSDPFADGLLLTNEAQECERTSYGEPFCGTAPAQFELTEPRVRIRKGILCGGADCANRPRFKRRAVGPPGLERDCDIAGLCPRVLVDSMSPPALVKDRLVDAADRLVFIVIIENLGKGPHGAHDVVLEDALTSGFLGTIDPASLCVTYGNGSARYTGGVVNNRVKIEFLDALAVYAPEDPGNRGKDLFVVTYDVNLKSPMDTPIGQCTENTAKVVHYSNHAGGDNFVPRFGGPFEASVSACVRPMTPIKTIVRTSESHTPETNPRPLAIGEVIRFQLKVHIPEGTIKPFVIDDRLPAGLERVGPLVVTTDNASSLSWSGNPNSDQLDRLFLDFGTVTNADNDEDCEYLIVEFDAIAADVSANVDGALKQNKFTVTEGSTPPLTSNTVVARIVEPKLEVAKVFEFPEGRAVGYFVTITNSGTTSAFEVEMNDVLGDCLPEVFFIEATITAPGLIPLLVPLPPGDTRTPSITIGPLPPRFTADLIYGFSPDIPFEGAREPYPFHDCVICEKLINSVIVTGSSLPGDGAHEASKGRERAYSATATATLCGCIQPDPDHDCEAR